jgi:hypothetical protein
MATRKKQDRQRRAPRNQKNKGIPFSCRLRPATRAALEAAARRNGRTTSAEADFLLDFALSGRGKTHAVMALVADAIDQLARMRGPELKPDQAAPPWRKVERANWLNDGYCHRQARLVAETAFQLLAPPGPPPDPTTVTVNSAQRGKIGFEQSWDEMRIAGAQPGKTLTMNVRRLVAIRAALGSLPDKVVLYGVDGREARRRASALTEREKREFSELVCKQQASREELEGKEGFGVMTEVERDRYLELMAKRGITISKQTDTRKQ